MKKIAFVKTATSTLNRISPLVLLLLVSGCSPKREAFNSQSASPPPAVNPVVTPEPNPADAYEVSWTHPEYPNYISFSVKPGVNLDYKRINIYTDTQCLDLVDIVTPEVLQSSAVMWPMSVGVNHIATVVTTATDEKLPCQVVASSSTDWDYIPPESPKNFTVTYAWLSATSLQVTASWDAPTNNTSDVEYALYLIDEPNGYAAPFVAQYTNELSRTFIFEVDPALFSGTAVFTHLLAHDQVGNYSPLISDPGFFIGTLPPVLEFDLKYLYRGESGVEINFSGTCHAGHDVEFYYQNADSMASVLPLTASCPNGTYTVSSQVMYSWYNDGMSVTARQQLSNGVAVDVAKPFLNTAQIEANLWY